MSVPPTSVAPASLRSEAEDEEASVLTQPRNEVVLLDVDASETPTAGVIDLASVASPGTAPPPTEDIVPEESIQPLQAALTLLSSYTKTLHFTDQQDTVSDFGTAFLRKFATYYHESKSILVLKGDPTKTPNSCKV